MSRANPENFPWGNNEPTRHSRLLVAALVSLIATLALYFGRLKNPSGVTDFHMVWQASREFLAGFDPYRLIGPGLAFDWPYPMIWPGTTLVAVAPFTLLPVKAAALSFVAMSTFCLVLGLTRESWHRLPIIASAAFLDSVLAAQWSMILTAALFLPWLAVLVSAKPQTGLPVLAASSETRVWTLGIIGSVILLGISLFVMPGWPREWLSLSSSVSHMKAPLFIPPGFLLLILLTRWRRRESWLLLVGAALPQTLMWYGALMPLVVARTYRQACSLSMISTLGFLVSAGIATKRVPNAGFFIWAVFLLSVYFPPAYLVLRQSNDAELPTFLRSGSRALARIRALRSFPSTRLI